MPFELTASETASVAEMKKKLGGFETEIGRLKGLDLVLSPTDVVITTSPKAGTTWVQQICHQLRAGIEGDMSFEEISEVVPFIELAHDQGQDLEKPQFGQDRGLPRCFKTHAWEPHCPKGGKYIVVVREPKDVALSFYNFFEGWFFEPGEVPMDAFVQEFWLARGAPESRMSNASFYDHFLSWYNRRLDADVLFLFFEDLKADLKGSVRKIAKFMSTKEHDFTGEELINAVVEKSSFAFMHEHKGQFDEKLSKLARNEACGLAPDAGLQYSKIRAGEAGGGKLKLSTELQEMISERWSKQMLPATGCASYDLLRQKVCAE
eukprot:m.440842 g.440842  ORF g.440842 m.440842 type:complete len:320 (-) comp18576_c0_seq1:40-999(-)